MLSLDLSDAILSCVRRETSYDEVAHQFSVLPTDIQHWEAEFIAGGCRALRQTTENLSGTDNELGALNAVSQSLSAILDLDELLDAAIDNLHWVFGYNACVGLVEGTEIVIKRCYNVYGEKLTDNPQRVPISQKGDLLAWVAFHGRLRHVHDTAQDPLSVCDATIGPVGSELALPLIYKGTVHGVLSVRASQPNAFRQRDISVLETVAVQLAIAIENALLFAQVQRRINQLELVQSVTAQAIENLDVQVVLQHTIQAMQVITGYASVAIGLIRADRATLELTALSDGEPYQVQALPIDPATTLGTTIVADTLLHIPDLTNYHGAALRGVEPSSRSALVVPMRSRGLLMGAISVESSRRGAFDDSDVTTLTTLADQLMLAIYGAGLFQQTQAQLREISLFHRLADKAIVGIVTRTTEGIIDYANPAAAALFGYTTPAALHGKSMRELYPDEVWYQIDQELCATALQEGGWSGEIMQQAHEGRKLIADMSLFPINGPDGSFMTLGAILQDATERHKLLEDIEQANRRFEAIFDATIDAVIVWDEDWRAVRVNSAAERLLGVADEALTGWARADWVRHPRLAAVVNATPDERFELPGDQRRIGRCRHLPWQSGNTSGHLTIIYDETSQVELEEAREEMISMLVHDLRSPLTAVVGGIDMAQIVSSEDKDYDKANHFLGLAARSSRRLLDIANSLLDITKFEAGKLVLDCRPLQIDPIFEDAVGILAPTIRPTNITVDVECADDLPTIGADNNLIRRALGNLLDNAIKFTPNNGQITLTAQREGAASIRFSVMDTGPGVPESFRKQIFQKYTQIPGQKGRRSGTGLGLAFCKLAAEIHGGRIWVEPRPGGGSIFSFTVTNVCAGAEHP